MTFNSLDTEDQQLIEAAADVLRKNDHPVKHAVGAAVRRGSGRIYTGINIEACGYGDFRSPGRGPQGASGRATSGCVSQWFR
jgi:hypothetical protein